MVGIVVDQLRTDYIEYLNSCFSERGFRLLMQNGAYLRDVDFNTSGLDAASATGLIYTGAYPSQTGVPSAIVYDNDNPLCAPRPALAEVKGASITNDSFTPALLRLSTLSDELAADGDGTSTIYSVSADPQQAVIMAGHAGNAALWINNTSGNWATTSYYGSLLQQAQQRNMRASLASRIDTMTWRPSATCPADPGRKPAFRHTFPRADRDVYKRFAASPLANAEVTDMAIEILRDMPKTATQGGMNMLNLGYTVAPYKYSAKPGAREELTDSYLKLDGQLARLFDAIDRYVGRGNALIFLSSTGYYDEAVTEDKRLRIPGGEFSVKRARSLLNSYLTARHGNAAFVTAIRDGQVYFDRKAIEDRGLRPEAVIDDACAFLHKMSGVADVIALDEVLKGGQDEDTRLRNRLDPRHCGDLTIRFAPGWTVVDDEAYPPQSKPVRESAVMTPAFIMGPGVNARTIDSPVDATTLSPTVAGILRIRSPNGARSRAAF